MANVLAIGKTLVATGLLLMLVGTAVPSGAQTGVWIRKADLPTPRIALSTCVVDGTIYAIGGMQSLATGARVYNTVEAYDIKTDSWTRKAGMPTSRFELATCVVDGRIHAAGGIISASSLMGIATSKSLEVYDPVTDSWTRKADLPDGAGGVCNAEVVDGRIYLFSAFGDLQYLSAVDVYDPATDTWSHAGEMPADGYDIVTCSVGGRIYAILGALAGSAAMQARRTVVGYEPATDEWASRADMPTARYDLDASVVDGRIYAIGGYPSESGNLVYATVEVYDPVADAWARAADLPEPKGALSTSAIGRNIYAIGGLTGRYRNSATVYMYDPGRPEQIDRATVECSVVSNQATPVSMELALKGPAADGTFPAVELDLSPLGVKERVPFRDQGQGRYAAEPVLTPTANGRFQLPVWLTPAGAAPEVLYGVTLTVLPSELALFADGSAPAWRWKVSGGVALDSVSTVVYEGSRSLSVQGTSGVWGISCKTTTPLDCTGYVALRLALYPGDAVGRLLEVKVNDQRPRDLLSRIDLTNKAWQVVEMPLDSLGLEPTERLTAVSISGNLKGTFYVDDVRLVAAALGPPVTAVLEGYAAALPRAFALAQNYPNPFNSETVLTFELPQSGEVELALYNLAGQQVVVLARGRREAGTYVLRWDGRDEDGQDLASGVYLYQLRAGERTESRKLVLLR